VIKVLLLFVAVVVDMQGHISTEIVRLCYRKVFVDVIVNARDYDAAI
jgi:hypothetical protein